MVRARYFAVGLALLAGFGCDGDVTGPPEAVRPELEALALETAPTGEMISVRAVPADPEFELEPGQQVPVIVTTSSGDSEELALVRRVCEDEDGAEFVCDELLVGMEAGHTADDVAHLFDEIDAVLLDVLFEDGTPEGGQVAHLKIFSGDVDEAVDTAADWPDVRYAERNGIVRIQLEEDGDSVRVPLQRDLRAETAEPEADDGVLQLQPSDTVATEYLQPDGSAIEAEVVVEEESRG